MNLVEYEGAHNILEVNITRLKGREIETMMIRCIEANFA